MTTATCESRKLEPQSRSISLRLMAPTSKLGHLSNAIVTLGQLSHLQDGSSLYWTDDAQSIRFVQAELTQAAGVLLRLPQEVIANAIVILQRFWINFHSYAEDKVGCFARGHLVCRLTSQDKINFRSCTVPDREVVLHSCLAPLSLQCICLSHIHGLPFVVRQPPENICHHQPTELLCYGRNVRTRAAELICV